MTHKKSVCERVQEALPMVVVPKLRISVPALTMDVAPKVLPQSETQKRRDLLMKCRNDLETIVRRESRDLRLSKPAA